MKCFEEFLRYCLDATINLPESAKDINWREMYIWAQQQAIIGIIFCGIERAGKSISVPREELLQWIAHVHQIERHNHILNNGCVDLCEHLNGKGLDCCIIKGQGVATLYPHPLRRFSGDIDVWTRGKSVREIILIARENAPYARACYHHVDYGKYNGIEVEVHYRPTFKNNLFYNRRIQHYLRDVGAGEMYRVELPDGGKITIPTWEFNFVFLLSHIYGHVIQGGIGLRQIIDYYYLLKSDERGKKEDVIKTLEYLGLKEIAGALMWILKEVLGLQEEYLIAPIDERRGQFLYEEIMQGGNFGYYDKRVKHANSALRRNLNRLKQDMRLVKYFPSECLWEPVFRVYHYLWRLKYN